MKLLKWITLVTLITFIISPIWSQREKEVIVKTEKGTLYGSLIRVLGKKKAPLVIIIPGSGPTDRNGNGVLLQTNSYKFLAQELAEHGISSLRYDKFLVGKSKADVKEEDLRFEDNVDFVCAWIDYLKEKKYQDIILLGHSEGSLIGMLAAKKKVISKFISIAGTGRSIDKVLLDQLTDLPPLLLAEAKSSLEQLKRGEKVKQVSPELSGIFGHNVQPYLISWMKYSPKKEISNLNIPVLIVHGTTDLQVTKKDAEMQELGNKNAELIIIDKMNHIFKKTTDDKEENKKTYYQPNLELHHELIPALVKFIL